MMKHKSYAAVAVAGLLLSLGSSVASAQLSDKGEFFSPDTESRLNDAIRRIKQAHGKTLAIDTYPAIPSSLRGQYTQAKSREFFVQWIKTLGQERNASVMILITRDPGHYEVGSSVSMRNSGAFAEADHREVGKILAPWFKAGEFDDGILKAVEHIDRRLGEPAQPPAAGAAAAGGAAGGGGGASPRGDGSSSGGGAGGAAPSGAERTGMPGGGMSCGTGGIGSLLCVGIALFAVFTLVRGIFARRSAQQGGYGQGGFGQGGYGQGGPGYPPQMPGGGYQQGGYPQQGGFGGFGGGGGGGFGRGVGGGLLGGLLGGYIGSKVFGGGNEAQANDLNADPNAAAGGGGAADAGGVGEASSGGDFGAGADSYGGVEGGGGDFGGGDFGGDSSGGDF